MKQVLSACLFLAAIGVACSKKPADPKETVTADKSKSSRKLPLPPAAPPPDPRPHFVDVSKSAGIAFRRYDDQRGLHRILEANGGGVAVFDYDCDGFPDLFFANGCWLPLKDDKKEHRSALFRNNGDGTFSEVTSESGLIQHGYAYGVAAGDFNNDGYPDLYVNCYGPNTLWQNNGDGTFSEVKSPPSSKLWGSSAAWIDLDQDGLLDLYVENYVLESDEKPRMCPDPNAPDGYHQCTPTQYDAAPDFCFRNNGDGTFTDITTSAGLRVNPDRKNDSKGLGVVAFDANGDGRTDLYVANDGRSNFLFLNKTKPGGPIRFEEVAAEYNLAVSAAGAVQASMGVACGDADGDGKPDLLLTHFENEYNTLYVDLLGDDTRDATRGSGLGGPSRTRLGFGTEFFDYNNNGRLDLFVSNGHVDDFSYRSPPQPYQQRPQLFLNNGPQRKSGELFREVSQFAGPFFESKHIGRGVVYLDFDNDGDMDLAVNHQRGPSSLVENQTKTDARSVVIRFVGTKAARSATGTRIEAKGLDEKIVREILGGASFQSSSDRRVHIGLGSKNELPELEIRWLGGTTESHKHLKPGRYVAIEGAGLYRLP